MKLLLVHNFYQSPIIGGEDKVFTAELEALTAYLGADQVFQYCVSNDAIRKISLVKNIWGHREHAQAIYNMVREHNIAIVHVHNYFPVLTPAVFTAAKAAGAKVVLTLHNYRPYCLSGLLYREKKPDCTACVNKIFKWPGIKHGCYRNSKLQSVVAAGAFAWYHRQAYFEAVDCYFALTPTQYERMRMMGIPYERMMLKPNGINIPAEVMNSRSGYLYVGRIEPAKGTQHLLHAWQGLNLPLTLIGHAKPGFKTRHSAIQYLGQQTSAIVKDWMHRVKYLIHPGEAIESFGLTVVEALAAGTPVIALNRGTRRDFIQHRYNGFLCEPSALAETICEAERYPHYHQLQRNARQSAMQYQRSYVMEEQIQCYQKLLKSA